MKFPNIFRPTLALSFVLFAALGAFAQPSWTGGYPQLVSGATSVDIKVQTDSDGIIYYVIYSTAQAGITSTQVKNDALFGGLSLVRRGNVTCTANTLQTIKQATLTQNTTYHIYLVAESNGVLMNNNAISYTARFFPKRQQEFYNFANSFMNSYLMYFPEDYYRSTAKYPCLIFLGGSGEMTKGGPANPSLLLLTGLPEVINLGKEVPMIVASPQGIYSWSGSHVALDAYVEFLKVTYRIDPAQIFLTGLSDGGIGDFEYANYYPSKIKAIAPTSTWPNFADIHNFLHIPVWAFMGDIDDHNYLISWINQLKAIGGNATYTEYPGAHTKAVWNKAYDGSRGDDIYSWLLYGTGGPPPPPNLPPVVNAGYDQSVGLPLAQFQVTATASDPDGSIASYSWSKISGSNVTMTTANTPTLTLTNINPGTYLFQVTVQDNKGASAFDQVIVNIAADGVASPREYDINMTWAYNIQGGSVWNDFITTGGGVVGNSMTLFDINHLTTPVRISITAPFVDGNNNHGGVPGLYPNNVMFYYLRSTTTTVGALKVSGLGLDKVYDLSFMASNTDVWYPSDTRFTANGQSVTVNAKGNYNQLVSILGVPPNASGEINITVAPATTNSANNGVINALILKERAIINNASPVVNAGLDQLVTLPLSQLVLNGTATDPDGTITSLLWTKVSGPNVTMANTTTSALTLTNIAAGTYVFQLRAQDNASAVTTDQVTVTVNPGIIVPPVVNAGLDRTLKIPVPQLQLTGTATDSDGFIYSLLWTQVSGPAAAMTNTTTSTLTLTNLVVGAYVFQLSATDNSGGTSTDQVLVTVNNNVAPVVDAGPDQLVTLPLTQLQVSGTATDPDGTIVSLLWTKVSGPAVTLTNTTTSTLTLTNILAGTYVFQLRAQDDGAATTTDQVTVTVNPGIIVPPVVNAGPDQTIKIPVPQLQLTGTATDSDGFIYSVLWTQVSGPAAAMSNTSTNTLTLANLSVGPYVFQFSATDNSGGTSSDQVSITIISNLLPLVDAGPDQLVTLPLTQLQLPGSASDPDGTIVSLLWTKVSGPNITLANTTTPTLTLTNIAAGTYVFQLSAQDDATAITTDQVTVTVDPGIIVPPVVNAGVDRTVTLPLSQLQLAGIATDSDGFIYSVLWTKVSGPAVTLANTTTLTLTLTNLVAGTYVFQLSAQDNAGATVTDQVTVTVNNNVAPVVNAGPDQTLNLPLTQLLLTGTATDTDGTIASLLWTKVSGPVVTLANTATLTLTLTNILVGTYVFQLMAQDNGGATTTDQVTITVNPVPITGTREFDVNLTWSWNLQGGLPWNDFITNNGVGTSGALFDKNGLTSPITISTTAQFSVDGANNHGVVPGLYPKNVMMFYLRSTQTIKGALKFAGLNIAKQYDVSIMCSNYDFWYPSDTRLTVQGQVVTFNATSNANQLVNFTNIAPSSIGEIPIAVAPATTVSNNVGVINAIVLTEHDVISTPGARTTTQDVAAADRDKPSTSTGDFVNVSPNPVEDHLNVEINSNLTTPERYSIEFSDIRGVPVHTLQIESQDGTNYVAERISADFMQTGMYIMAVRSRQNGVKYFKILKK